MHLRFQSNGIAQLLVGSTDSSIAGTLHYSRELWKRQLVSIICKWGQQGNRGWARFEVHKLNWGSWLTCQICHLVERCLMVSRIININSKLSLNINRLVHKFYRLNRFTTITPRLQNWSFHCFSFDPMTRMKYCILKNHWNITLLKKSKRHRIFRKSLQCLPLKQTGCGRH